MQEGTNWEDLDEYTVYPTAQHDGTMHLSMW